MEYIFSDYRFKYNVDLLQNLQKGINTAEDSERSQEKR
jgi:hypothetical protein